MKIFQNIVVLVHLLASSGCFSSEYSQLTYGEFFGQGVNVKKLQVALHPDKAKSFIDAIFKQAFFAKIDQVKKFPSKNVLINSVDDLILKIIYDIRALVQTYVNESGQTDRQAQSQKFEELSDKIKKLLGDIKSRMEPDYVKLRQQPDYVKLQQRCDIFVSYLEGFASGVKNNAFEEGYVDNETKNKIKRLYELFKSNNGDLTKQDADIELRSLLLAISPYSYFSVNIRNFIATLFLVQAKLYNDNIVLKSLSGLCLRNAIGIIDKEWGKLFPIDNALENKIKNLGAFSDDELKKALNKETLTVNDLDALYNAIQQIKSINPQSSQPSSSQPNQPKKTTIPDPVKNPVDKENLYHANPSDDGLGNIIQALLEYNDPDISNIATYLNNKKLSIDQYIADEKTHADYKQNKNTWCMEILQALKYLITNKKEQPMSDALEALFENIKTDYDQRSNAAKSTREQAQLYKEIEAWLNPILDTTQNFIIYTNQEFRNYFVNLMLTIISIQTPWSPQVCAQKIIELYRKINREWSPVFSVADVYKKKLDNIIESEGSTVVKLFVHIALYENEQQKIAKLKKLLTQFEVFINFNTLGERHRFGIIFSFLDNIEKIEEFPEFIQLFKAAISSSADANKIDEGDYKNSKQTLLMALLHHQGKQITNFSSGRRELLTYLMSLNPDLSKQDTDGRNILHILAKNKAFSARETQILQSIIMTAKQKFPQAFTAENSQGDTPYSMAVKWSNDIFKKIIDSLNNPPKVDPAVLKNIYEKLGALHDALRALIGRLPKKA